MQDGGTYEIKIFHAERKPEGSSFQLKLTGLLQTLDSCEVD